MRDGNACLGFVIGAAISIPIYGAIAWVVSRVARIDYWLALIIVLAVGSVAGGITAYVALRRAPKHEEALESLSAKKSDPRASR